MRILFATAHISKGGGQAFQALQLWRELSQRFDSEFLCLGASDATHRELEAQGATVVGDLRFPSGILALARAIQQRAGDFDLLQVFDTYYSLPAARLAWRGPIVLRVGMDPVEDLRSRYGDTIAFLGGLALQPLLKGVKVVTNSTLLRDAFAVYQSVYIPNGVDFSRLQVPMGTSEARAALGLPSDVPLLLFIGKVIPRKGLEDLLGALRSLPLASAVIVGNTAEEHYGDSYYRRLREEYHDVVGRATFTGEVPFGRVPLYLRAADVFVFPSRLEGTPNALLEAMGAGLPAVALDTPEHRALISDGKNGFVYRDESMLVDRLSLLLGDSQVRGRVGAQARLMVAERYSFPATADAYARLYESLVAQS